MESTIRLEFYMAIFKKKDKQAKPLVQGDHIIGDIVHHVHAAGAGIQHDGQAAQFILMNHLSFPLS